MNYFYSKNHNETEKIGQKLARVLKSGDVVAFFGGLGMGKTAFTRGLVKGLNIDADVSSPTFALVHEYEGNPSVYHFDMYRVSSWDDLSSTGYFDYLESSGILAIEWSENIENALPQNYYRVEFEKGENDNDRIIKILGENIDENFFNRV